MRIQGPATVHISDAVAQVRVAAFVWRTAEGVAWLEPDYLEPDPPPRPSFHRYDGRLTEAATGVAVQGPQGLVAIFDAAEQREDPLLVPPEAAEAIVRFRELLQLAGTTWEAERLRVAELLAVELGEGAA